jgi:hypothetical protein
MKKPLLILIIILAVILALPVVNMIRWVLQEKKPLDILVLDKTVPTLERENHRSFMWILTNERFVKKSNKRSYSYKKDYYGFFPLKPLREKQYSKKDLRLAEVISLADSIDALYYTDTYGVFFNDWWQGTGSRSRSRRTRKLYGGLNNNDYLLVSEMKKRNKLIVLEYNTIDYPTADLEKYKIEEQLGIKTSGWTGKCYSSLDTLKSDIPIWMTTMYRKEYKTPWAFTNAGIVILNNKEIIVLEEGKQLVDAKPYITTSQEYCDKYGVVGSVFFENWFDIIDPGSNNVISKFKLETTALGDSLLTLNFLSSEFPAVVQDTITQRTYYFAGDFAKNTLPFCSSMIQDIEKLKGVFYSKKPEDSRNFFWQYYRPLITGIFGDYYDSENKK